MIFLQNYRSLNPVLREKKPFTWCVMVELLTSSHSMVLKKGCDMISMKPVSLWQPNRSAGFLLRKPFRMEAALTLSDRGIRIVFSRITETPPQKCELNVRGCALRLHDLGYFQHRTRSKVLLEMMQDCDIPRGAFAATSSSFG